MKWFQRDIRKMYLWVENSETGQQAIRIRKGPFKDVVYGYENVHFGEKQNPDGTLPVAFKYNVFLNPRGVDIRDKRFVRMIGDIIVTIMEETKKKTGSIFPPSDPEEDVEPVESEA